MKIVCVQTFPVDYCIDYVNAIAALGDVTFLAAERQMAGYEGYVDARVDTVLLPWPRHRSLGNLGLIHRMCREIRSRKADIVHFLGDGVTWLSVMPRLVGNRPVTITVHDARSHPGDTLSLLVPAGLVDLFHRHATRLIVHGESVRMLLAERARRPLDDIDIVPHAALKRYPAIARRHGLARRSPDGRVRLLFFGRVMAYKGLGHLLDALDMLSPDHPEIELVIAGQGPGYREIEARLQAPHVRLHRRFVPDEDAAQLFLDADLVVLPYIEASQSGILAMAAAFGRPVLVTDIGELGETARATGMGLIVPPADGRALADAIRHFLNEPDLRERLSANSAAAAATGLLAHDTVARAAHAAYETAIGAHAGRGVVRASA
ncbi:MAG: glycosyltransferase family 4 protein [Alphaproteobacteria bacterium]